MIKNVSANSCLQEQQIRSYLGKDLTPLNMSLHVCESVDSTNDYVMSRLHGHKLDYLVCAAGQQTNGRGRNGRRWQSPAGSNIYMSIGVEFSECNLSLLNGLSLACGVSVARFIDKLGVYPQLKWPNDILVSGEKLAGLQLKRKSKEVAHLSLLAWV